MILNAYLVPVLVKFNIAATQWSHQFVYNYYRGNSSRASTAIHFAGVAPASFWIADTIPDGRAARRKLKSPNVAAHARYSREHETPASNGWTKNRNIYRNSFVRVHQRSYWSAYL